MSNSGRGRGSTSRGGGSPVRGRGRGLGRGQNDEIAGGVNDLKLETWTTWNEFCKWFWKESNGNHLIKKLNASPHRKSDYVRREKLRPVVYCVVVNERDFPGTTEQKTKTKEAIKVEWKLCKVGFTHVDTTPGTNNRMETLMEEVCKKYNEKKEGRKAKASVLFKLPIGAVDTTPFFDTEKRIRLDVGWPIRKDLAKKLGLPCSTEWVLTTQGFINKIIEEIEKRRGTADPIDLFKDLKFCKQNPMPEPPPWAVMEFDQKDKTSAVVTDFTHLDD